MKRPQLAAVISCLAILLPQCLAEGQQLNSDVLAVVDGKAIRRDQVEIYYRSHLKADTPEPSQEEAQQMRLNILDELINNEALFQRALKLNLVVSDAEVEGKFLELKKPYTEEEFQAQLKERGIAAKDVKNDLRRQLSITKLMNREVVAKIAIKDQDVADFYNSNKAQFNVAEPQYRIAQIVVTPKKEPQIRNRKNDDATNEAEAQRKVKMLMDRLNSGADFAQLAMDYSEDMNSAATGGDLGYVPESALNQSDPALKKMVIGLKPGQVSPPIQLKGGYRILKLITRESPGLRGITDPQVQQSIRDTLRNREEKKLGAAYIAEARSLAHITNYEASRSEISLRAKATASVVNDVPRNSEQSGFVALKDIDSVWQFPEYPPRPSDEGPGHLAIAVGRDAAGRPSLVAITYRDYGAYGKAAAYAVAHLTGEFPPHQGGGSGIWQFEETAVSENNLFATGKAHSEAYISNGRVRWRISNDGQTLDISEVPGGDPTNLTDHAEKSSGLPPPWLTLKRVTINPNTRLPAWIEGFYRQVDSR